MGSRRAHEQAAVAAARAAYLAGFTATSNLEAGRRYGMPTAGTAAHAFTLLHDSEGAAFASQIDALGVGTTLLVDTYDITTGIATAIEVAGPELGAIRIDSGDLGVLTRPARRATRRGWAPPAPGSCCPATWTNTRSPRCAPSRWTCTGWGRRWSPAPARPRPAWSTSSSRWTAGRWRSAARTRRSHGGAKSAMRRHRATGTATEEVVFLTAKPLEPGDRRPGARRCRWSVTAAGRRACRAWPSRGTGWRQAWISLPWEG